MSTYNVLNAGSREVLNLDGALTKEDAEQLAYEIERNSDIECEVVCFEVSPAEQALTRTEAAIYAEGTTWTTDELFAAWMAACEKAGERISPQRFFAEVIGESKNMTTNENASDRTEEYAITDEDRIVIEWDGEVRTIRTFTRGTASALYTGDSLDAAAESLEITREQLDESLMGDAVVRDRDGNEIDR